MVEIALQQTGHVQDYLPHNSYLVSASVTGVQALRLLPNVVWIGDFKSEYKIDTQSIRYTAVAGNVKYVD